MEKIFDIKKPKYMRVSQLWNDQNDRKGEGKKAGRKKERKKIFVRPHIQGLLYNSSFMKVKKNK
jgi:hypothetical protein